MNQFDKLLNRKNFAGTFGVNSSGHLCIEGKDAFELTSVFGSPLFVISKPRIISNYQRILNAFSTHYSDTKVFYSFKTNYCLALCKILEKEGAGAEVVSDFELDIAKKVGFSPEKIIYNNPCKTKADLCAAIRENVALINVDSVSEVELVSKIARRFHKRIPIVLRIDPFENVNTKFGLAFQEAQSVLKHIAYTSNVKLEGLHFHLGTMINSPAKYEEAINITFSFMSEMKKEHNLEVNILDIGGGFPSHLFFSVDEFPKIEKYASLICQTVKKGKEENNFDLLQLYLEPGRAVVNDAVCCLGKIVVKKNLKCKTWAFSDLGLNLLPSLRSARYAVIPATKLNEELNEKINIVGPLCMEHDVLSSDVCFPTLGSEDVIAVLNCGAYTMSLSNQFSRPRPAVVMVSEGDVTLVRKKESFKDLTAKEIIDRI